MCSTDRNFNTKDDYAKHADLMNIASDLTVEIFGDKGKHARGTLGASSTLLILPWRSRLF
jgi:hypothetical protein